MKINLLFIPALLCITGCSVSQTTEKAVHADTLTSGAVSHGYNELANPGNRQTFSISDYNSDNEEIENIDRPERSTVYTQLDTSLLFDAWAIDPDGPHAIFDLTPTYFRVVDYDGDGDMPYELNGNQLKIYYNDFIQEGKILSVSTDTLKILWQHNEKATVFLRWKQ